MNRVFFRSFLFAFLFLSYSLKASPNSLIDSSGNVHPKYVEIIDLLQLPHFDRSVYELVSVTQNHWLRGQGKERWHMQEIYIESSKKKQIMNALLHLGLIKEIRPQNKHYNYAIVNGATLPVVRKRLFFLKTLIEEGIQIDKIIVLGSARPLDPLKDPLSELFNPENPYFSFKSDFNPNIPIPKTEFEMMKIIYEQSNLGLIMSSIPVEFYNTEMIVASNGHPKRPSSEDLVATWLASSPQPGTCLAIFSQPHVYCQQAAYRHVMPSNFSVEGVGYECPQGLSLAYHLDNLARWLYIEHKNWEHLESSISR